MSSEYREGYEAGRRIANTSALDIGSHIEEASTPPFQSDEWNRGFKDGKLGNWDPQDDEEEPEED
jgi:hypothetical protein